MISHQTNKRVRYGETDQMGYLYYGNYALYFEIGRVEFLRSLGLSYQKMESEWGVMMPVVNMSVRYLRPAHFDDEVIIHTSLRKLPDSQITFHFELKNSSGKLLTGGRVVLCFVEIASQKRISCPPRLLSLLNSHFA